MTAFDELDTRYKIKLGGKGVGRLTWLKVFEKATIESVYRTNDRYRRRIFEFALPNGVEKLKDVALEVTKSHQPLTIVSLLKPLPDFDEMARYRASRIAAALVRHFLHYLLLLENPPKIDLTDGDTTIPVQAVDVTDRETGNFEINGQQFSIEHMKLRSPEKPGHLVYYTAARRTVKEDKLRHLPDSRFRGEKDDFYYQAYVSSPYLDVRVNQLRTDFAIEEDDSELSGVTWKDLRAEVMKSWNWMLTHESKHWEQNERRNK